MPETFVLGRQAVRQIQRMVRNEMMRARHQVRPRTEFANSSSPIYIGKTGAGGIAALSGTTPGSGDVQLYYVDSDGDLQIFRDSSSTAVTVTAYNIAGSAVAANVYVQLKQEAISGCLLVDFEDCS